MNNSSEIHLRPFQLSDKYQIAEICNNKKIWDNLTDQIPHPYSVKDAENFIDICTKQNPPATFIIDLNDTCVGCIGLVLQKDIHRLSAELGYWVGEPFWNKGIATNAVKLILKYGFEKLNLIRVYADVYDFNKASQKVLEKSGFRLEGIFAKAVIKNNNIIDEYRYGIVKQ